MSLGWRTALKSSGLWSRAGPKGLGLRYSPTSALTALAASCRHVTPASARPLNTAVGHNGPPLTRLSSDMVSLPGRVQQNQNKTLKYGRFFLRENCQCPRCIHPDTKQRISDTFSIPQEVKIESIKETETAVEIQWSDNHLGHYPFEWLGPHAQNKYAATTEAINSVPSTHTALEGPRQYTPVTNPAESPRVQYEDVMSDDKSLGNWLNLIWTHGFCFVDGVPVNPQATQLLIERIAFIRHTHYGGFWDFTADLTFKDTAYTNEFLGAHTDNTYFTDPARLQLFHLLSHTEGTGGDNLMVDGFAAATQLRHENPQHYAELVKHRHPWHASGNDDTCIQPSAMAPVFSMHPDMNSMYQIRWNNYDRAPKVNWSAEEQSSWYDAARHYNEILQSKEIWTKLEPGSALIFDNWRMLHGRSQFTGKRRMCGGYVNNDDYISRLRLLKCGRENVLNNLGNIRDDDQNPYHYF